MEGYQVCFRRTSTILHQRPSNLNTRNYAAPPRYQNGGGQLWRGHQLHSEWAGEGSCEAWICDEGVSNTAAVSRIRREITALFWLRPCDLGLGRSRPGFLDETIQISRSHELNLQILLSKLFFWGSLRGSVDDIQNQTIKLSSLIKA